MSRPLRILFKNAYYHVINRGREKKLIFHDSYDKKKFLSILKKQCCQLNVSIAAYCLMDNHYHLLINTPHTNLSTFMQRVNATYVQYYNRKYTKDGALFCGRYKSYIIGEESYLLRVIRYIHINPVKAQIVPSASTYEWSTHKYYKKGSVQKSEWLCINNIMTFYDVLKKNRVKAYREHIAQEVDAEIENFYKQKKRNIILGSETFKDKIKLNLINPFQNTESYEERTLVGIKQFDKLKSEVLKEFKVSESALAKSERGSTNIPRQFLVYASREQTRLTYKEISKLIPNMSTFGAKTNYYRFKKYLEGNKRMERTLAKILKRCSQVTL